MEKEITQFGEKETRVLIWIRKRALTEFGGSIDTSEHDWTYATEAEVRELLKKEEE